MIPHGQQFRALMQKELEFNKIGMIETSAVLAGFTFTVVSAHFWPLAMTAILGYLVNSVVRTLLFGYLGRKIYRPGLHVSLVTVAPNLRGGAWLPADSNNKNLNMMQKELEFNKIGMIETSAVLAGFTFTVVSAHFWPLAMTAILGYLVNSAVRTLLFGYFGA